jgi:intracellular sulfur oxidation DsrE/DsrF family protein
MPESFKLVLHVAQVDKWEAAIGNAANFLKTASPSEHLEIRIVANSDAVLACAPCSPLTTARLPPHTDHATVRSL